MATQTNGSCSSDGPPSMQWIVPWVLLTMGVVLFTVGVATYVSSAYVAGGTTAVIVIGVTSVVLAATINDTNDLRLPGVRLQFRRSQPEDEDPDPQTLVPDDPTS
jgi:hypothetical protein